MTTSLYMPDVKVEIAFDSGFSTAAASRTWTDVSTYVEFAEGISIGFGRGDELSTADANSLSLTLDNSDGRFTALRSASPYYPNVKIGRPIRVTSTPVGGAASTRFLGYVDEWPVEWNGTSNYAKATITAKSRMARIGLNAPLGDIISEELDLDSPDFHYTLGEPTGSTQAADSSGNSGNDPLAPHSSGTAVTFGTATGPGTDDLTAATFAGGQYLRAGSVTTTDSRGYGADKFALSAFINSTTPAAFAAIAVLYDGFNFAALHLTAGGKVAATVDNINNTSTITITSTTTVTDGLTHAVACRSDFGSLPTFQLFVDGVQEATSGVLVGSPVGVTLNLRVGGFLGSAGYQAFTGVIAHVAGWTANSSFSQTIPANARFAAYATAGSTGFAGETPAARVARYAAYAGIPSAEVSAETGTPPMSHVNTTGASVLDMLHMVETTEGGVLFDARDNTLTFHARGHRYTATTALTLDMALQQVEADYTATLDRSAMINDVTASITGGTATARAVNQTSVDDYGLQASTIELATTDVTEPDGAAQWRVNSYGVPMVRVPAMSVDLTPLSLANQTATMGLTVGSRVQVTNHPTQASSTTGDYFVEGYTETIGLESYSFTFNLSPAAIYTNTFIFDAADRGFDVGVFAY